MGKMGKLAVLLIAILAISILALPTVVSEGKVEYPLLPIIIFITLVGMSLLAIK